MATKKQKREALAARKAIEAEEVRLSGLRAQAQDKKARALRAEKAKAEADKINKRHNAILAMHGLGANALAKVE